METVLKCCLILNRNFKHIQESCWLTCPEMHSSNNSIRILSSESVYCLAAKFSSTDLQGVGPPPMSDMNRWKCVYTNQQEKELCTDNKEEFTLKALRKGNHVSYQCQNKYQCEITLCFWHEDKNLVLFLTNNGFCK